MALSKAFRSVHGRQNQESREKVPKDRSTYRPPSLVMDQRKRVHLGRESARKSFSLTIVPLTMNAFCYTRGRMGLYLRTGID